MKDLTSRGILPAHHDLDTAKELTEEMMDHALHPFLMGKVAGTVNELKSAKAIVDEIVDVAAQRLTVGKDLVVQRSKL